MKNKSLLFFLGMPMVASANNLNCDVSNFSVEGLTVSEAKWETPQKDILVDNCVVHGLLNPFIGTDGQDYGIQFELRLPKNWSHQFAYQFNGGSDGIVKTATGYSSGLVPSQYPLNRGMAVISSNGGHDSQAHPDKGMSGGAYFGLDARARKLYGYGAVEELAPVANKLVEQFYGEPASFKYGIGSSNGGRMGMVVASRFPEMFDGILSGYPGYNLPKATLQHAWDVQHLSVIDTDITKAFSKNDLNIVSNYILKQCDELDGLKDGLIFNSSECQSKVNLNELVCENDNCLTQKQANALIAMHEGPKDKQGKALYSEWLYDAGLNAINWRFWKLESSVKSWGYTPRIAALGAPSLAMVFLTPPDEIGHDPLDSVKYLRDFDINKNAARIYATNTQYPESAMEFMTPLDADNPQLSDFKKSNGKMIVFHGNSDPVFSVADTIRWYKKLDENNSGHAKDFVSFYQIPGMAHGTGGPSMDRFDMVSALVNWVELGQQPNRVISEAHEANNEIAETLKHANRPLCPYPSYAAYRSGNPNSAASFDCK